jgi:hypothetical protein
MLYENLQFQATWFRAGHAHAGVLLLLALFYYLFRDQTALAPSATLAGCMAMFVGILAQSGGSFVHMIVGQPSEPSIGSAITTAGAAWLATALVLLIYGLATTPRKVSSLWRSIHGCSWRHAVRANVDLRPVFRSISTVGTNL